MADILKTGLGLLTQIAPSLATAFGGPVAGLAVQAIEQALGLTPTGDQDKALTALAGASPEQLLAIKKADNDFAVQMKQLDIDLSKIEAGDRDSARRRQADVKDHTPAILAYMLTIGFFGLLGAMMFKPPPPESRDVLMVMLGALGTGWTGAMAFFYGSTRESAAKTGMIGAMARKG